MKREKPGYPGGTSGITAPFYRNQLKEHKQVSKVFYMFFFCPGKHFHKNFILHASKYSLRDLRSCR